VGLSWLRGPGTGLRSVAGHLVFLHNNLPYPGLGALPLFLNNPNLWSLHYEFIYYVSFLLVWLGEIPAIPLFLLLLAPGVATACGWPIPPQITRYACGGLFWYGGLTLAWQTAETEAGQDRIESNWASALLTAYAIWTFELLRSYLLRHGIVDSRWPGVLLPHRLDFLPAAVWVLLAVTGRARTLRLVLSAGCLLWAAAGAVSMAAHGGWTSAHTVATGALVLAVPLAFRESPPRLLAWLAPLGGISYALYLVSGPIQLGQRALFPGFSGSALTYGVRLVAVTAGVVAVSWLLEHRLQPWLVSRRPRAPGLARPPAKS